MSPNLAIEIANKCIDKCLLRRRESRQIQLCILCDFKLVEKFHVGISLPTHQYSDFDVELFLVLIIIMV